MISFNTPSIDQTNEAVELSFFFYGYSIFQSFKLNLWRLGISFHFISFHLLIQYPPSRLNKANYWKKKSILVAKMKSKKFLLLFMNISVVIRLQKANSLQKMSVCAGMKRRTCVCVCVCSHDEWGYKIYIIYCLCNLASLIGSIYRFTGDVGERRGGVRRGGNGE